MTSAGCPACHAQPLTTMVIEAARLGGRRFPGDVEPAPVRSVERGQHLGFCSSWTQAACRTRLVYATMAMAAQQMPPSRATDAFVRYLAAKQRTAGNWKGIGGTRAPMQDGDFSRTAMAIRALTVYGTPARTREYQEHVGRAAALALEADPADDGGPRDAAARTSLGKLHTPECATDSVSTSCSGFSVRMAAGRKRRISPAMRTPRDRFCTRCGNSACLPADAAMQTRRRLSDPHATR